jgi:hypothetical protein
MIYSYEEARRREAELMRSAQRVTVSRSPRQEKQPSTRLSRILGLVRVRHVGTRKPAVGSV